MDDGWVESTPDQPLERPREGEPQGPSRLGFRAEPSENLADSNGSHR